MVTKLIKYIIFSTFIGILTWLGVHLLNVIFVFPDWRIQALTISVLTFIFIVAIKRGVWH